MPERSIRVLVSFVLLAGLALGVRACLPTRTAQDPEPEAIVPAAPPETLALPRLEPGATFASVNAYFAPGTPPRSIGAMTDAATATWEWSEPAGRYALVAFEGGRLVESSLRRPYGAVLPAVEVTALPGLHEGQSRDAIERAIGAGWPIERTTRLGSADLETDAWSVRDRGVGTGALLRVTYRDGVAISVAHPWRRS